MTSRATHWLVVALACAITSAAQTSTQFTSVVTHPAAPGTRRLLANESHMQNEILGKLYANSAFAHGYRHGYEQGFHVGDLDIHMGRDARLVMKLKEYGQASQDYQPSFGSKVLFQEGYEAGFRGGYADAISGAEFRASERAKAANAGLRDLLPSTRRAHFDEGVAAGYKSAQSQNAPATNMTPEYVEQYCRQTLSNVCSLEYCSGFSRGYMLGISDTSVDSSKIVTAQKVTR